MGGIQRDERIVAKGSTVDVMVRAIPMYGRIFPRKYKTGKFSAIIKRQNEFKFVP